MEYIDLLGYIAAFLTTISTLPQFISTIRTKNVQGVSLGMFITLGSGILLWFFYGFLKSDYPLIFANLITLLLVIGNIIMILKYKNNNPIIEE